MVSNPPELLAALDKLILALKSTGKMEACGILREEVYRAGGR